MYSNTAGTISGRGIGQPLPPVKTQHVRIASGESGNFVTLGVMKRLVREGSRSFAVRQQALAITQGIPYDDAASLAAAIMSYLAQVPFVMDPYSDQTLYAPELSIQLINAGEAGIACASIAVVGAALARSIGMRTGFMLLAFKGGPKIFSHIFAMVSDGDIPGAEWYDLDSTAISQRAGRAAPIAASKFVAVG